MKELVRLWAGLDVPTEFGRLRESMRMDGCSGVGNGSFLWLIRSAVQYTYYWKTRTLKLFFRLTTHFVVLFLPLRNDLRHLCYDSISFLLGFYSPFKCVAGSAVHEIQTNVCLNTLEELLRPELSLLFVFPNLTFQRQSIKYRMKVWRHKTWCRVL